jgi:glyoxylase-like metal-dependent hydrolase (beta-lactamase superfamily II)
MTHFICITCGTQYPDSVEPPAHCPICEDERQYVNPNGQAWTTLGELRQQHQNVIEEIEPGLHRIKSEPKVGIGQYAFLVRTGGGNVLWDCITLLDDATITAVNALGGIKAIAISHPHYHGTLVEWSKAFNAPVYIHAGNREWIMRPDPGVVFWEGMSIVLVEGVTVVHCGGHFEGATIGHWDKGADGRGVVLCADTIDVVADTRYMSFMYSYPNLIPLPASKVRAIVDRLQPYSFDRMYDAFGGITQRNAKERLRLSAERYVRAISE